MEITNVAVESTGKVRINWSLPNSGDPEKTDTLTLSSFDTPLASFTKAMNALATHVLEICHLPDTYRKHMTVTSITFRHREEGMGAVITAKKILEDSNSPFMIHTPFKQEGDESGLSDKAVEALEEMLAEAEKYIRGDREQLTFSFLDAPKARKAA